MWVRRSDWERVTEMEELVGRLSVGSRFPQYLYGSLSAGGGGVFGEEGWNWGGGEVKERVRVGGRSGLGRKSNYLMTAMFTGAVVLAR